MGAKFGVNSVGTIFFWALFVAVFYLLYLVFQPFLNVLIIGAILTAFFYPIHKMIKKGIKKSENVAAFISTLLVIIIVIVPLSLFVSYVTVESVSAFQEIQKRMNSGLFESINEQYDFLTHNERVEGILAQLDVDLRSAVVSFAKTVNAFLLDAATNVFKGAATGIINLVFLILILFFGFRDGRKFVDRIVQISPLFNKYDKQILDDLKSVSHSAIGSTLVAALVQGLLGAVGFMIVGVPGLFLGIAMAVISVVPLIGSVVIWLPVGIYLLLQGFIWQAIFILLWGSIVISLSDNVVRAIMIKGKKQRIHPLWVMISVLGGIALFGFLGIIYGPAILAFAYTMLHIYELEYSGALEK